MKLKSLFIVCMIAVACLSLYTGSSLYEHDTKEGVERDIFNYTDTYFTWNESIFNNVDLDNSTTSRVNNIVLKIADTAGYIMFETTKLFIEIGYNSQGKYNLSGMLKFIQVVLWVIIISIIFYPALVIGVLLYELFKYVKRKLKKNQPMEDIHHEE